MPNEEDDEHPTVVIDSSIDDRDYAAEFRRLDSNTGSGIEVPDSKVNTLTNIQAALRSIKLQEEEEDAKAKKKKVTIMSVEEEEAIISQINEIRERIRT